MRRIPDDIRKAILKRVIAGDTYRTIQRVFNISPATINQIKEEAKKTCPDIDDLIKLNILLKKSNVNFYDTFRGANLLDRLNSCGISAADLDKFIKLMETLFLEGNELREDVVAAAIKLMELEEKTGKAYPELLEDFQKLNSEFSKLKNQINRLKEKKHRENVKISALERSAKTIKNYNLSLHHVKNIFLDDIYKAKCISNILKKNIFDIPCKGCGCLLPLKLPTKEEANNSIRNGLGYNVSCQNCGTLNWYHPDEIIIQLGWVLLPSDNDYVTLGNRMS